MPDDTMLPDDDRDLSLARRLGAQLEKRAPLDHAAEDEAAEDASFYRALLSFKRDQEKAQPAMPAEASERVWAALGQRIAQDQAAPEPRPALRLIRSLSASRSARTGLAMAASVLLLAVVGWLLWGGAPTPVLLATAEADIVTYTAPDGSVVRLRPHSQLYSLDEDGYRLVGEGFFDVIKNETRTVEVEAGEALIAVLGTRFNVSTWGGQTAVFLAEGRVRFEHAGSAEAVVLEPGQRSLLTSTGTLVAPASADSTEYLDWLKGEMTFAQRPLHRVLEELAYHFAVTLDVPDAMRQDTVTGRLFLQEREQSLTDLGAILEGRFVQVDDDTYRFVAN